MHTAIGAPLSVDQTELPSMLATLCWYESWFGPYHAQTLRLMAQLAIAYWQAGETRLARPLLERAVRDLARHLGGDHDLRWRAITALSDLFIAQGEFERAAAVQKELLECQIEFLGPCHPDTVATRASLATILLEKVPCDSNKEF